MNRNIPTMKGIILLSVASVLLLKVSHVESLSNPSAACEEKYFYHNLTDSINAYMASGGSDLKKEITAALRWSPLILYSTPVTLNKVTPILLSVIDYMRRISSEVRIILSLQYTERNRFAWARLEDLFYDLHPSLEHSSRTLIKKHLSNVVLDWTQEWNSCSYGNAYDFLTSGVTRNEVPLNLPSYSFPKYVKNFLQLHYGAKNIPVGVIYTKTQTRCPYYFRFIWDQLPDADFHVVGVTFEAPDGLTLSPPRFYTNINQLLEAPRTVAGHNNVSSVPILVSLVEGPALSRKFHWGAAEDFLPLLKSFPDLRNMSHNFIENLYNKKYPNFFTKLAMTLPRENKTDVIFAQTPDRLSTLQEVDEYSTKLQKEFAIPHLNTSESTDDLCSVIQWLKKVKAKHRTIAVNLDTWRYIARYKKDLEYSLAECDVDEQHESNSLSAKPNNVIVIFRGDILKMWAYIEPSVTKLLNSYPAIFGLQVTNVMFPAEDIQRNKGEIANWLKEGKVSYNVGCSISFDRSLRNWKNILNYRYSSQDASTVFKEVFTNLCEPLFEKVSLMIWNVEDDYDYLRDFPGAYNDVFFLREVFLREFPNKQVIVKPRSSNVLRTSLAEIYEAPVLLQQDVL